MNVVFLFLTRADLASIPKIPQWLNEQKARNVIALVNPHLALDPTDDQVALEKQILDSMKVEDMAEARITLELTLQKRWMQVPRDVLLGQLDLIFKPFGLTTKTGVVVLSESFQSDRLPELLTKIRPAWPAQIPGGEFVLVFANQVPDHEGNRLLRQWAEAHKEELSSRITNPASAQELKQVEEQKVVTTEIQKKGRKPMTEEHKQKLRDSMAKAREQKKALAAAKAQQ